VDDTQHRTNRTSSSTWRSTTRLFVLYTGQEESSRVITNVTISAAFITGCSVFGQQTWLHAGNFSSLQCSVIAYQGLKMQTRPCKTVVIVTFPRRIKGDYQFDRLPLISPPSQVSYRPSAAHADPVMSFTSNVVSESRVVPRYWRR
jgi:hypothetical protein